MVPHGVELGPRGGEPSQGRVDARRPADGSPSDSGALVIDETGDRKDGKATAHVGKQYLGGIGKMAERGGFGKLRVRRREALLSLGGRTPPWPTTSRRQGRSRLSHQAPLLPSVARQGRGPPTRRGGLPTSSVSSKSNRRPRGPPKGACRAGRYRTRASAGSVGEVLSRPSSSVPQAEPLAHVDAPAPPAQ